MYLGKGLTGFRMYYALVRCRVKWGAGDEVDDVGEVRRLARCVVSS